MTTKLDKLLKTLDEIIQLLDAEEEQHWSEWMRQSQKKLLKSDSSGIEYLLAAYGGMGSFNDFQLGNGEKNENLNELRTQAWDLAESIRRNHILSNS